MSLETAYLLKLFNVFVMAITSSPPRLSEVGRSVFPSDLSCVKVLEHACQYMRNILMYIREGGRFTVIKLICMVFVWYVAEL